jgi:hypothetical protein
MIILKNIIKHALNWRMKVTNVIAIRETGIRQSASKTLNFCYYYEAISMGEVQRLDDNGSNY